MKWLIACEESQAVTIALRERGHEAYSCDLLPCSGGHPEWHFQSDMFEVLDGFDVMIAFPPCTHLAVSGAAWFEQKRKDGRQQEGIDFFMKVANYPIKYKAIENPIGIMSSIYRKPDQIIQPWMFGHGETKATCLWLTALPKLVWSNEDNLFERKTTVSGRVQRLHRLPPSPDRAKLRSKTYPGIAAAMAEQWGNYINNL
jgi:hypothetical protein